MPSITSLPNELVVLILENLCSQKDAARLCRVSRRLYEAVSPVLYKNAVDIHDMWPLVFAAFSGHAGTMRKILGAGADPNWVFDEENMPRKIWFLLLEPELDRVPKLQNTQFGRPMRTVELPRNPHVFRHPYEWSPSPDVDDEDVDAGDSGEDGFEDDGFEDDGFEDDDVFLMAADVDIWNHWASVPSAGPALDALEDHDPEHHSPLPGLGSIGSSTLGSSRLPQNGAGRAEILPLSERFTSLHIAAAMGNVEAVELLLDHGASIGSGCQLICRCRRAVGMLNNVENPEAESRLPHWTPLHVAICYNRPDAARVLLRRGASCMMEASHPSGLPDPHDSTALHYAAALGQVDLVRYLVDNGHQTDIDVRDGRTLTPFYYAYANGRWDSTVPLLLQMGADINVEIKFYQPYCTITPLGEAIRLGNFDDAKNLLDLGANHSHGFVATGACHRKGLSPLQLACMLPARLFNFNESQGNEPRRLLDERREKAVQRYNIIEEFIAKGTDIHNTDCSGDTPLISAAQNLILPSVRALVAAGADVNARNSLGHTVIMQAVLGTNPLHGHQDAYSQWPSGTHPLLFQTLGELVRAGARIDEVDPQGNNILHLLFEALQHQRLPGIVNVADTICLLLAYRGADALLTSRNKEGLLAFELAFYAGASTAYDVLLRPGSVQRVLTSDDLQRMCRFVMLTGNMSVNSVRLLLDLDVERKILSCPAIFERAVISGSWTVAEFMASLVIPSLDQEACTRLMWHALEGFNCDIACQLIDAGADVHAARDGSATTPLGLVIRRFPASTSSIPKAERLIQVFVDKGVNIHGCASATSQSRPLTVAIMKRQDSFVQAMLRGQPLRDDPRAVGGYYLHTALRDVRGPYHLVDQLVELPVVYGLIHSGADLTELNEDGDCPLAVFLQSLCDLPDTTGGASDDFSSLCSDLLQDLLAPGLQITKPNKDGYSVADYLEEFLQTKIGRQWLAPKLDLDAGDAKILKFKPDMRLRRMPHDRPVATIWDALER